MVVGEALFELFGDFCEHLVGIERADGMAGNVVEQRQVARAGLLFLEQARVLNGDAGFAGQHAHQFEMSLVKHALLRAVRDHHADGAIMEHQGHSAETSHTLNGLDPQAVHFGREILADEQRLAGANQIFGQVIPHGAGALRQTHAFAHFQFELDFVVNGVVPGHVKIVHVKEPLHLFPNLAEQRIHVQRGAEGAADLVQDVQLFGAPGGLLDQVAVLVSEREQKA